MERFDIDALDDDKPFEVDGQVAHLFKHPHLGLEDVEEVWASDPLFYPATPPAHWLMVAEVKGKKHVNVLMKKGCSERSDQNEFPKDSLMCRVVGKGGQRQERRCGGATV